MRTAMLGEIITGNRIRRIFNEEAIDSLAESIAVRIRKVKYIGSSTRRISNGIIVPLAI